MHTLLCAWIECDTNPNANSTPWRNAIDPIASGCLNRPTAQEPILLFFFLSVLVFLSILIHPRSYSVVRLCKPWVLQSLLSSGTFRGIHLEQFLCAQKPVRI